MADGYLRHSANSHEWRVLGDHGRDGARCRGNHDCRHGGRNTPIMEWNVFNGLRALSATIAVELPEAVKGGSLYRILFLSGLVLFAMTFVINTIAEVVRIRFRRRAAQL